MISYLNTKKGEMMANNKSDKTDFWNGLGSALFIFALLIGIGSCTRLAGLDGDRVKIEREKTRQLEIQLKIEETKNAK